MHPPLAGLPLLSLGLLLWLRHTGSQPCCYGHDRPRLSWPPAFAAISGFKLARRAGAV